jgi:FkbM family methyltransferase
MGLERVIGQVLVGSPAYKALRYTYQAAFDREAIDRRKRRRKFYSQFISAGDLVFDVGANLGNYAEAFCALGAVVVAIEPDPRNVAVLRKRLKDECVHIEPCAIGKNNGTGELHISDRNDVSTLSAKWTENTQTKWVGKIPVPVRTLDSLASQYGVPKYVKVDTEGFDYEVLCGMSFEPSILSFEFLSADLNVARNCISALEGRLFNFVVEEQSRFHLGTWVNSSELLRHLSALPREALYGDVFARWQTLERHPPQPLER